MDAGGTSPGMGVVEFCREQEPGATQEQLPRKRSRREYHADNDHNLEYPELHTE